MAVQMVSSSFIKILIHGIYFMTVRVRIQRSMGQFKFGVLFAFLYIYICTYIVQCICERQMLIASINIVKARRVEQYK